jgi:hypothetical protein
MNASQADYLAFIAASFYSYETFMVVPLGTLFNIATVVVFLSSKFKQTNFGFISSLVTLAHIQSLLLTCVIYKYLIYRRIDLSLSSEAICFCYVYLMRFVQLVPSFLEVFLSAYQYLEITFIRDHFLKKRAHILLTIGCQLALVALAHMPNLFRHRLVTVHTARVSASNYSVASYQITCSQSFELATLASVETFLLRAVIPITLIATFSYLIAHTLFKSRKLFKLPKHHRNDADSSISKRSSHRLVTRELSFAFSLFVNNLVYFLLNFPVAVSYVIDNFSGMGKVDGGVIFQIHNLMNALSIFYSSLPFFINYSFNRTFRAQVNKISFIIFRMAKCNFVGS